MNLEERKKNIPEEFKQLAHDICEDLQELIIPDNFFSQIKFLLLDLLAKKT